MNGIIDNADYQLLQQYLNGSSSLSQVKKYLADLSGDNAVNSTDLGLLNNLIG